MADALNDRWNVARRDFTRMTGKSKPRPKGMIDQVFNHTGVSTALKICDKLIAATAKRRLRDARNLIG